MWIVFDTESNDMLKFKLPADHDDQARIVQLAAALCGDDLEPVASMCRIIRPEGWKIEPGAQACHGISLERAMDEGVAIAEAIEEFDALFDQAQTLVAFNAKWDNKFIRGERRRLGRDDRFGALREFDAMRACTPVCKIPPTAKMSKAGRHWFKSPKLEEAYRILLDAEMDNAHDAAADVEATRLILKCLRDTHGVDITGEFPKSYQDKAAPAEAAKPAPATTDEPTLEIF